MRTFGYTPDDITTWADGVTPKPGVQLYVWAAEVGGAPLLNFYSSANGSYGWTYDTTADGLWLSAGLDGARWYVEAHEAVAALRDRVDTTETRLGGVEDELPLKLDVAAANSTYGSTMMSSANGIKGDGTTDDGAKLNALLTAAANAGASVTLAPGITIRTTVQIVVPSGTRLIGNGATIKAAPVPGDYTATVKINGADGVYIENLTIDGNRAAYAASTEWKHGIEIAAAKNVHLSRVTCTQNKGEGIALTGTGGTFCEFVVLEHCRCVSNSRNALGIISAKSVRVIGGTYSQSAGAAPEAGIDVEPNTVNDVIEDVEFDGVDVGNNTGAGVKVLLHGGARHHGPRFTGGRIHHNGASGFGTVVSLVAPSSVIQGLELVGVTIDNNTGVGVDLSGSAANFRMIGCRVYSNTQRGINVVPSSGQSLTGVALIGCTIRDNSTAAPGTLDGVRADQTVNGFTMAFCRSTGSSQRYGLTTSATVTGEQYYSNDFSGNTTGTYLASGQASSRSVMDGGNVLVGQGVYVNGQNVVKTRKTGWTSPTGTGVRTAFDTGTATTADLAQRLKALIDDLTNHGLIGP